MRLARDVAPLLLALLLASGCDRPITSLVSLDGLTARAGATGLLLHNGTADLVRYIAFDPGLRISDMLAPADAWPSIAPGAEVTIPYSKLNDESRPQQVRVFWWTNGQNQPEITVDVP